MENGDVLLKGVEMYCMEATCPHLSAPLSHAEFAEEEEDQEHIEQSGTSSTVESASEGQQWDLEPEMRDMEDVVGQPGRTIVCPWHLYDFDLRDGSSSTGMSVCVYTVEIRATKRSWDVYVEEPAVEGKNSDEDTPARNQWEVVEVRGVSEDFADPPPPPAQQRQEQPASEGSRATTGIISSITSALTRTLNLDSDSAKPGVEADDELPTKTLLSSALLILQTSSAPDKIRLTRQTLGALRTGKFKSLKPNQKDVSAAKSLFEPLSQAEEAERISRAEDVKQGRTVEGFVPPRGESIKTVDVWNVKNRGKGGNEKSRILMLRKSFIADDNPVAFDLSVAVAIAVV